MNTEFEKKTEQKTVGFLTLGCKVNSYETEAMQKIFEDDGYLVVDFSEKADVYVVNTCTVTNIADRKSRQMLHKARKMNEDAIVIAVGCYAETAKETLEQDESLDLVIGNNRKKEIIHILNAYKNGNNEIDDPVISIQKEMEYEELHIESVAEKTRAYIKIQDGCNQFCSYCIIPYARGRVRSRDKVSILTEVAHLVDHGYKEVVLTGIHLSSYGIDFHEREQEGDLLNLILSLCAITGLERLRLGSLEPRIITEQFVKKLSKEAKFCPHFHLSLQSGCNETLLRMNRRYTAEEYQEKCQLIRQYFVEPAITTDVIVGFPGETIEEYQASKEFVKQIAFSKVHIFKYSVRKGTKAENMKDQVREDVKAERSSDLILITNELTKEYQDKFIGKTTKILVEEEILFEEETYQIGHDERYLKLAIKGNQTMVNEIKKVRIIGQFNKEIMLSEIID